MDLGVHHVRVPRLRYRQVLMFEDDLGHENSPAMSEQRQKIEDVVNVIVDPIAEISFDANAPGKLTEFPGEQRKRAERFAEDELVYVDQQDSIRVAVQDL